MELLRKTEGELARSQCTHPETGLLAFAESDSEIRVCTRCGGILIAVREKVPA